MKASVLWLLAYMASRGIGLALLVPQWTLLADFTTYGQALARYGATRSLPEYPWLAGEMLELPFRFGAGSWPQYYGSLIALFLVVDAAYAALLWQAAGRRASRGFVAWLLAFPLLGPLMVTRFDIVAAVLAGAALLALGASRPARASVLCALGAAIKIWPAIVFPALFAGATPRERRAVLAALLGSIALVVAATVLAAGAWRLLSPFAVQATRGLEVEAFAALPFLWARLADAQAAIVVEAECKCLELRASGVQNAISAARVLLVAGALGIALLYRRALRGGRCTPALAAELALLSVLVWIATNKVFSPQYMVWVAGLLAACGVLSERALHYRDVALFLAACALTQILYPSQHAALFGPERALWPLAALTLRDLLLLVIGVRLALRIWGATRA